MILTSDPDHCGECGHSCLGGVCLDGRCPPAIVAAGESSPLGVAVDDSAVYWTTFVGATGSVRMMDRMTLQIVTLHDNLQRPAYIALTDQHLYWTEYDGDVIKRSGLDGSNPELVAEAPDVASPFGIAVDGQTVYWANGGVGGEIRSKIVGALTSSQVLGPLDAPEGLAFDAGQLYVAEEGGKTITRFTLPAGPSEVLLSKLNDPVSVTVDDSWLYYSDQSMGAIFRAPKDGGSQESLIAGAVTAGRLANTADASYWAEIGNDRILKLAK